MKTSRGSETRDVFARNLRRLRERFGISQVELAERAELHRTYVSSVERGERNVTIDDIHRLAKALRVQAHVLLKA